MSSGAAAFGGGLISARCAGRAALVGRLEAKSAYALTNSSSNAKNTGSYGRNNQQASRVNRFRSIRGRTIN